MTPTRPIAIVALIPLVAVALFACSRPADEVGQPVRIENASLGLAVAILPSSFEVIASDGPTIELERVEEPAGSRLTIEATGELPGGINLMAEAESMQNWFEQQPQGQYFGNLELGTPHGPAFTARGSYVLDGTQVEELRVFALHPATDRMLRLTYRYPPGTGKERLQQLAEVLGEIEALQ